MIDDLVGRHLYLDANALIALVEYPSSTADLQILLQQGQCLITTNLYTLGEVLIRPLQLKAQGLVGIYKKWFEPTSKLAIVPLNQGVLQAAAELAAEERMSLSDSIHIASAKLAQCDVFLSDDRRLRLPASMERRALYAPIYQKTLP